MQYQLHLGDCLSIMKALPPNSVDLIICSPPYEDRRTYDLDFNLKGNDWVEWATQRYLQCHRVCRGLTAWVVEGKTNNYRWSATPVLLMARLMYSGISLRKPPIYHRTGIPGSGGPDWWRNDYEFILCSSPGKLPWSQNTASGHKPKYGPGGKLSHRTLSGDRTEGARIMVDLANPGNVIYCSVGGGHLGDPLAHENEAPYPESLIEPFIKCFCPPGGTVLDPFCGSGTTLAVAVKLGRRAIGIDIRESQLELTRTRLTRLGAEEKI